jgi:Zn-finger nucleic acid-binding protein
MQYDTAIHSLECPKCGHGMVEISHEHITIDRCTHCEGMWFDADEAHQLKILEGSHAVDTGHAKKGWIWDSVADISCPRCGKAMDKSRDPKQRHIWYEVCHEHGMFLDAGEFRDLRVESVLDVFRGFVKGDRHTTMP